MATYALLMRMITMCFPGVSISLFPLFIGVLRAVHEHYAIVCRFNTSYKSRTCRSGADAVHKLIVKCILFEVVCAIHGPFKFIWSIAYSS